MNALPKREQIRVLLKRPVSLVIGYVLISALLGFCILQFHLPESSILILSSLLILAVLHYPIWVFIILACLSAISAVGLDFFVSPDFLRSIPDVALVWFSSTLFFYVLWRTNKRHIANEKNQEERFHNITETSSFFETWQKADGSFDYISPSCEFITGYSRDNFYQNSALFYEMIHPDDQQLVKEAHTEIKRKNQGIKHLEFRIIQRNGKQRWIEHHYRLIFNETGGLLGRRSSNADITERKLGNDALKKKYERLMLAIESTEDGVWDANLTDGSVVFTPRYAHSLGSRIEKSDTKLKDLYELIHPDDLPTMLESFKSHLLWKTSRYQAEYRLLTPEGKWRWVLDRGKVIEQDNNGKPIRMVGSHMDITQRKTIEEALSQSETKFRQLAENMREVFWLREKQSGNFIYVSPAFTEIWNRDTKDLYSNQNLFVESIHWEDLARVLHSLTRLVDTGDMMNEEYRIIRPDGTIRWVWTRAYPIYQAGDQFYRIAGVVEDITERRQTESALRDSERRYRDLIEHQGGGVCIIDPNLTIVYMNPAGEEIFGVPRGTIASRSMREFLDDEQYAFLLGQSNVRQQGIESSYELIINRPNKERHNLLITATPRFDVNGQFLGAITIFRDNTQRKQSEDKLRYISLHDTLTGLYNRAYFEEEIGHLEQSGRYPVGVIMVDLDGLKTVNDQLGHQAGDQMLVWAGKILKDSVRANDIVARIGGDEFVILMPASDDMVLQHVSERININMGHENELGKYPFALSLSQGGFTCYQRGGLREAIQTADQLMYEAKQQKKRQYFVSLPAFDSHRSNGTKGKRAKP